MPSITRKECGRQEGAGKVAMYRTTCGAFLRISPPLGRPGTLSLENLSAAWNRGSDAQSDGNCQGRNDWRQTGGAARERHCLAMLGTGHTLRGRLRSRRALAPSGGWA